MEKSKPILTTAPEKMGAAEKTSASIKNISKGQTELEKGKVHIIVEILEYVPHAIVSKTIIKKTTGNITITSVGSGEELAEKTYPDDTYVQIIDGAAEVVINEIKHPLKTGDGIIIPANAPHCFNANVQFKMIATTIKSTPGD